MLLFYIYTLLQSCAESRTVTKVHSQETQREGLRNRGGRLTNANTTHEWVSLFSECMATGDKNYQYT